MTTMKELKQQVSRLNKLFGYPVDPYRKTIKGKLKANPNVFLLRENYGSYGLSQMASLDGCERDITALYPKHPLFLQITTLIQGAEMYRDLNR